MARELNKEFIETLVSEPLLDFSISKGSKVGDNASSEILAIKVTTKSNQTLNLVYKSFPENPAQKAYAQGNRIFRIETAIYQGIVPAIQKLLEKANVTGKDFYVRVPKFFAAFNDDENDFLCLEDLRPKGYVMPDKFGGLKNAEVSLILKELGKFHALTYHLIKYEGEKIFVENELLKILSDNLWTQSNLELYNTTQLFGASYELGLEIVQNNDPKLAEKMRSKIPNASAAAKIWMETQLKTDIEAFPVIVCGDLWTNNILIKYGDQGNRDTAEEVMFLDFQQSRRGCIYSDLNYFLLTSTTPEERGKYMANWLNIYYDSFMKTLNEVGCPPPQNFTRGYFIDEVWKSFLPGFVYMCFAIPFQLGNMVPTAEDLAEAQEPATTPEESARQLVQLLRKWMDRSPRAINRLLEITREFVQLGLF